MTTRNRLRGVMTLPEAQVIFVDTPGIHKPHHELGKVLVKNARIAINSVDVTLFVVDGTSELGRGDLFIADLLKRSDVPIVLSINKGDSAASSARSLRWIKNPLRRMKHK